jgi:hypothetical protein
MIIIIYTVFSIILGVLLGKMIAFGSQDPPNELETRHLLDFLQRISNEPCSTCGVPLRFPQGSGDKCEECGRKG